MSAISYVLHDNANGKGEMRRGRLHRVRLKNAVVEVLHDCASGALNTRLASLYGLTGTESIRLALAHDAKCQGISPEALYRDICMAAATSAGFELVSRMKPKRVGISLERRR